MIPKRENPNTGDFRPISWMSNIYKLITKVLTINLYNTLEVNEVISMNQLCVRKNTMAAKEQVLFNHCINLINDFKLKAIWFDIQKAYDSVPHEYINQILKTLNLPENYQKLMHRLQEALQLTLIVNNTAAGTLRPKRGIIQGDSLSPLIFILCMEPISRILNETGHPKVCISYKETNFAINHLLYMDDLKILAKTDDDLRILATKFTDTLNQIGLKHNTSKSATNSDTCSNIADIISPINGYKYLGLIEDNENRFKRINLDAIFEKICARIKIIADTQLNSKNMFTAINEFALSLLNYYVGTINMPETLLIEWDTKIRRILSEKGAHYKTACKERLYLKRKYLGRGLNSLEFNHEKLLLSMLLKIEGKSLTCARNKLIKNVYENFSITAKELGEILRNKYNIAENTKLTSKNLTAGFQNKLINEIKKKEVHSKLFKEFENLSNINETSMWLTRGRLIPKTEANFCNLQDRNIFYQKTKYPHCNKSIASADHLASRCEKMLHYDYKKRHDNIQKVVVVSILNKHDQAGIKHYKYHKTKTIYDLHDMKILVDIPIKTDILISENRPDIVFIKKKEKLAYFVE